MLASSQTYNSIIINMCGPGKIFYPLYHRIDTRTDGKKAFSFVPTRYPTPWFVSHEPQCFRSKHSSNGFNKFKVIYTCFIKPLLMLASSPTYNSIIINMCGPGKSYSYRIFYPLIIALIPELTAKKRFRLCQPRYFVALISGVLNCNLVRIGERRFFRTRQVGLF
jgi:hypothetical protein